VGAGKVRVLRRVIFIDEKILPLNLVLDFIANDKIHMIVLNEVSKAFELSKQQRKEMKTTAKNITAVDKISFTCQPGRI